MILDGSAAFKRLGAHTQTCLLRFEGLVINPGKWLWDLLNFLKLEPQDADFQVMQEVLGQQLKQASPALVGGWRDELSQDERALVETICGGALRDLNYFGL